MGRSGARKIQSLAKLLEDAKPRSLRDFLTQSERNFRALSAAVANLFEHDEVDEARLRQELLDRILGLSTDDTDPVELESQRVLELTEGKGPTSLDTVADHYLSHEEIQELEGQPGELGRSLWLHAHRRRVFDDAVSFRNARIWRDGRLYSALEVPLEQQVDLESAAIPRDDLLMKIKMRLGISKQCGISVLDLPAAHPYHPSVLVIIRHPGRQTSVAEHPEDGSRRLHYFLPQEEVILIYTPAEMKIEVCGDTARGRAVVAESFAQVVLGHDVSSKPLTWANYDTSRFLRSLELDAPDLPDVKIQRAAVIEIEVRLDEWQHRLRLSVPFEKEISKFAARHLDGGTVLRRALAVSRVVLAVRYTCDRHSEPQMLEITISDRNRCNLAGNRDQEVRRFGRQLLSHWRLITSFRDLEPAEALERTKPLRGNGARGWRSASRSALSFV